MLSFMEAWMQQKKLNFVLRWCYYITVDHETRYVRKRNLLFSTTTPYNDIFSQILYNKR
jgi:hypothetical protein